MVIWAETAINHITQFIDDAKSGTEQTAKKYIEKTDRLCRNIK